MARSCPSAASLKIILSAGTTANVGRADEAGRIVFVDKAQVVVVGEFLPADAERVDGQVALVVAVFCSGSSKPSASSTSMRSLPPWLFD